MAIKTKCQTPGAVFETRITTTGILVNVKMPMKLNLTSAQAALLEKNIHNLLEVALAPLFSNPR
jgi:hypothetical protein